MRFMIPSAEVSESPIPFYNPRDMLFRVLHLILLGFYLVAPIGAAVIDALRARKTRRTSPGGWLVGVVLAGVIVGTCVSVLYAVAVGGKVRVGQTMLCSYFAIGMLLLLRGFDYLMQARDRENIAN